MEVTRNIIRRAAKAGRGLTLTALMASLILGSLSAAPALAIISDDDSAPDWGSTGDPAPTDDPVFNCDATVAMLHTNRLAFNMALEKTHSLYAGLSGADRKTYQNGIKGLREDFRTSQEEIRNAIPEQCKGA